MRLSLFLLAVGSITLSEALYLPNNLNKNPKIPACFWIVIYKKVPLPVTQPPPVVQPTPVTTSPGIDERNPTTSAPEETTTPVGEGEATEAPAET